MGTGSSTDRGRRSRRKGPEIDCRAWFRGLPADSTERFSETISQLDLDNVERWWIVNVDIALAPEEESKKYLDEFIKLTRK
jgi:hypothetical protein